MKPTAFAPSARGEFEAAAEWYESHASGLGDEFVNCVDEIVGRMGLDSSGMVVGGMQR